MNAQKITQTFNGQKTWQIAGSYFKLLSAQYPVTVELFYMGQKVFSAQQMDAGFYQSVLFDRVEVTTPLSEEVSLLIAPNKGGSDRLAGVVEVVDGGRSRTIGGQAFMAIIGLGAVAGQYPTGGLYNPVGSAVNSYVKSYAASCSLAAQVELDWNNTIATASGAVISRADGVTAGMTLQKYDISAAGFAAGKVNTAHSMFLAAGAPYKEIFSEPILLAPGNGLYLRFLLQNVTGLVNFELVEERI